MGLFDWWSYYFSGDDIGSPMHRSIGGITDLCSGTGGLDDMLNSSTGTTSDVVKSAFNPANGLPMVGGDGCIDIAGNIYGSDSSLDSLHPNSGIGETLSHWDAYESSGYEVMSSGDGFNDW